MKLKTLLFIFVLTGLVFAQIDYSKAPAKAEDISPILNGEKVPNAVLLDANGNKVDLQKKFAEKPTILVFYRGGWCPYCNQHLAELQDIEGKLSKMGYQIIAISPDRPAKLKAPMEENKLSYTLFSDASMEFTLGMGLAFKMEDELVSIYKNKYKIDVEADSGFSHHLLPVPAAFVIDKEGLVYFSYINPTYKTRVNKDILLAAAKALLDE